MKKATLLAIILAAASSSTMASEIRTNMTVKHKDGKLLNTDDLFDEITDNNGHFPSLKKKINTIYTDKKALRKAITKMMERYGSKNNDGQYTIQEKYINQSLEALISNLS